MIQESAISEPVKVKKQIVKFAVVGGLSTAIDGVLLILLYRSPFSSLIGQWLLRNGLSVFGYRGGESLGFDQWREASIPVIQVASGVVATLSSFYCNRAWTFEIGESEKEVGQFWRYLATYGSSILIHTAIVTCLAHVLSLLSANCIAIVLMTIYNFIGVKCWAFRRPSAGKLTAPIECSDAD